MTETATLKVDVVERGAKKVSVNLDAVSRAAEKAEKSTDKFKKELSATEIEAKKTGSALGALKNIAASYLTFRTIESAVKMADTMTILRSQVNLVTKSQEESITVQSKLFDISNRTYASLEATTTLYTRTARALQHLNKSSAETLKFTEAINNAMRLGGVSAGEQASALLQLSQAMGSGVLQGDEFRSLAENAPILLDILSKHMGVMRGELKQMGADGKITSEIIFEAMTKASDELSKKAASMPVTFGQAFQTMKNHTMVFIDDLGNSTGIMSAVASAVTVIGENIRLFLVPSIALAVTWLSRLAVVGVRALVSSMGFLAGPAGILTLAAGAMMFYATNTAHANTETKALESSVLSAATSFSKLNEAQLKGKKNEVADVLANQRKELIELSKEAEEYEKYIKSVEGQNRIRSGQKAPLEKAKTDLENINAKIADLNDRMKETASIGDQIANALEKYTTGFGHWNEDDFIGPVPTKEFEAVNAEIKSIHDSMALIGLEGKALEVTAKIQKGEYGKINSIQEEWLKAEAAKYDLMKKQASVLSGMQSTSKDIINQFLKSGMSKESAFIFDLKQQGFDGATAGALSVFKKFTDDNNSSSRTVSSGGGTNPFTDRLKSLSEEAAKLQAINAEIRKYGEAGRYTALQEITLELENQNGVLRGISATQKQMLLDQAALLDNQRQANEVLTLGSDYKQRLDDMGFELDLIGKTADEIDDLRFNRELEIKVRMIANGASQETIDLLTKEIAKIKELKDAYDGKRDATNNSPLGGISDGFDKYVNSMGTVREQFATVTESMFGGLTDAVASFASGADKNFSEMTRSVLQNISKMLIQMAIMNTMKMAFGDFFSGLGKANGGIVGFANGGVVDLARERGGFTGFGSKYEPADIVHKGEVVWSQADVARHGGLSQVERMRKGFSNGGLVGGMPVSAPMQYQQAQQSSGDIIINITQHEDGSQEIDVTKDGKALENLVKVNVKKEIANQLRSGGQLSKR